VQAITIKSLHSFFIPLEYTYSKLKVDLMPSRKYFIIFISLITLVLPLFSYSDHLADDIEPGDGINEIELPLTKKSAAELIHLETQGKILSVDEQKTNGRTIFKIKVLHSGGKIKHYLLDANTAHPPK
jgi:membrane-associated protease RseP (regulator of RpoE activity)